MPVVSSFISINYFTTERVDNIIRALDEYFNLVFLLLCTQDIPLSILLVTYNTDQKNRIENFKQ